MSKNLRNLKKAVSVGLASLMLAGSFVGSQKIIENHRQVTAPNAIVAVVATGGALAAVGGAAGGGAMAALGVDVAELAPIFEAAAAGATQAELLAMFASCFVWFIMIAAGAAIIA